MDGSYIVDLCHKIILPFTTLSSKMVKQVSMRKNDIIEMGVDSLSKEYLCLVVSSRKVARLSLLGLVDFLPVALPLEGQVCYPGGEGRWVQALVSVVLVGQVLLL